MCRINMNVSVDKNKVSGGEEDSICEDLVDGQRLEHDQNLHS